MAAGDANQATCPNEALAGFSGALPDCRAYELVTPAQKGGDRVQFNFSLAGGERVGAASIGLVAGATSNAACATTAYDLARVAGSGWQASAVDDAPLSELTYATNKCAKLLVNGSGETLLLLRPSSHSAYERDLYRQQPNDGSFVPVGPMLPLAGLPPTPAGPQQQAGESTYVAATPDLSHVLFALQPLTEAERWPGDTTILTPPGSFFITSLYEYEGTDNAAPSLVGLNNSGELISDCGTSPGGGQQHGNRLDTISTDGTRVFFTAVGEGDPATQECAGATKLPRDDELFARENGTRPQSPVDAEGRCEVAADACTVALSEPKALPESPTPDPGCASIECKADIEDEANFRDANFEGAAVNGTEAFFSSTQKLLNGATEDPNAEDSAVPRNSEKGCAATNGSDGCNLYEYDFAENPITKEATGLVLLSGGDSSGLGPEVQGVAAVSEDGSHVFFVAKGVLTETPNAEGVTAQAGEDNLYVNDTLTGEVTFIATLSSADASQWAYNGESPMDTTADGRYLVFTSSVRLTAGDDSNAAQVFRYDTATDALVRVSTGAAGYDKTGAGALNSAFVEHAGSETDQGLGGPGEDPHPAVSEGGVVVFQSTDALTAQALDNKCIVEEAGSCLEYAQNVYEYEEGNVYRVSPSGGVPNAEGAASISQSGRDIFFESREKLAPQDSDTVADIYDARVDGGFPASTATPACGGESCQGAPSTPPSLTIPASSALAPPASLPPTTPPTPKPKPKSKPLTRSQKLTKALKLCHAKHAKQARSSCESAARRKYGLKAKKSGYDRRTSR